ncbi:MAG: glycoside hydrolase family 3 protein [Lachnospirales bacterium]
MLKKIKPYICILTLLYITSCNLNTENTTTTEPSQEITTDVITEKIQPVEIEKIENTLIEPEKKFEDIIAEKLNSMTLEEKVGQMFIVDLESFSATSPVTTINELDIDKIKEYNIGGFIFFAPNIVTPEQITSLNNNLNEIFNDTNLFLSVDEEGGQVARISNNINFPESKFANMNTVKTYDEAYEIGNTIGSYLKKYGFNLNYAPLCDVLVNSENTVVQNRSFSSDPIEVTLMSEQILSGLHNNYIQGVAKHFPGHGSTTEDTHDDFAISYSTLEEMKTSELLPFENLINKKIDMIMISHVIYPNLSKNQLPATLNYDIITTLLKNDMGYEGIVITDAMNMGAISNNYDISDSTVMSVQAGADIILLPTNFLKSYNALLNSVKTGIISEEQINASVKKILTLKYKIKGE